MAFYCYQSSTEDRLSLWPIVRPMTHSYSGLKKSQGFEKLGTNLLDVLQLMCMCAFACVYVCVHVTASVTGHKLSITTSLKTLSFIWADHIQTSGISSSDIIYLLQTI